MSIDSHSLTADIRRRFRRARRGLSPAAQSANAEAVARAVSNSGMLLKTRVCGIYFALHTDGELDTLPLLARLWSLSKTVGCPVISGEGAMDFYRVKPTTPLSNNRYGIPEPRTRGRGSAVFQNPLTLSVLFMPLVAFDDAGSRLGMGAGYYDRYVGRMPRAMRPFLVGLAHEAQHSEEPLPRQDWDVPLDAVATEAGWRSFSHRLPETAGSKMPGNT